MPGSEYRKVPETEVASEDPFVQQPRKRICFTRLEFILFESFHILLIIVLSLVWTHQTVQRQDVLSETCEFHDKDMTSQLLIFGRL